MTLFRRTHRLIAMPVMAAPKPCVIFFDGAFDVDDVAMLVLGARLHLNGEITILAVMANAANDYSAPCAKAVLTWCGLPNIPVGAYMGSIPAGSQSTSLYAATVAAEFGQAGKTRADFSTSDAVVRAALTAASNNSVAIISTGFFTDMAALVNSASGLALVNAKVCCAYVMGGDYPYNAGEFNITGNITAAQDWLTKFTKPTMLMGLTPGGLTQCGPSAGASGATNPLKRAFDLFGVGNQRSAWDPATLLFFARGEACGYKIGMFGGNYRVANDGSNVFSGDAGKNCGILVVPGNAADRDAITATMNALVQSF